METETTETLPETTETSAPEATEAKGPCIVLRYRQYGRRKQKILPGDTTVDALRSIVAGLKLAGAHHCRAYRSEPIDLTPAE